ncbi:hypothetical protein C8J57DRAFT_1255416 [Mycena rebaudengoi]|nr:hypothetical protein C8J57DRAFT_1255416 [Mycena rebaudengoi]
MSAFNILGFFQLKDAHRIPTQNPNGAYTIWRVHYSTRIHCTDPDATAIAAELCVYSLGSNETLAENTVVFALCKAQALPIPGDPSLDACDDHMSNEFVSFVSAVGHVTGTAKILNDSHLSCAFALSCYSNRTMKVPGDSSPLATSTPASSEPPPSAPDANSRPQCRLPARPKNSN